MKNSSSHITHAKASMMLPLCAVAIMAAACSDDTFDDTREAVYDDIHFEVRVKDIWLSGSSISRSDTTPRPQTITLTDGTDCLYLVPSEEERKGLGRGCVLEDESLGAFGVFASVTGTETGPDYMYNEEVTSKNSWAPAHKYLWPGQGQLHFNAYVPYVSEAQESEGIISLPSPSDTGDLTITYKVPANVDEQEDLMWSTPCDASQSPCALTFNHALTAIRIFSGAELAPCTIKEISIKNVADEATLNLETGQWCDSTGSATYTIAHDVALAAASGSIYVSPGTSIVDGDNTFILMPQKLGDDASISLTIEFNDEVRTLEASLAGQEWKPGKVLNYRISANPAQQTLTLDVTGKFQSNYYLGTDTFTVHSSLDDAGAISPVKWKAEFVDDNGNVIDRPQWITDFPVSGTGDTHCSATTELQDPTFINLSAESQTLQNAADINQTSGHTPYNLASSTGDATIENTSNCYIINAPGKYSLPLVYGNAIKNGATNSAAYTSTSHNRNALKTFINHLNNGITDPYIYNNNGCAPAWAKLLWEAELGLLKNVSLSSDKKSITFEVGHSTIRQGNAVVAVYDTSGAVMWSWHIWVTDYVAGSGTIGVTLSGKNYGIYPRCLGEVIGGDITDFKERSVKVRFTQTDLPDGITPLTKTLTFTQNGKLITKKDRYTYYQWGRKDPMVPDAEEWYDADHLEITKLTQMDIGSLPSGMSLEQYWTLAPQAFWTSDHVTSFSYSNLWNSSLSTSAPVKSVYDPSPVGSMIPIRNVYRQLLSGATISFDSSTNEFYITTSNTTLRLPPLGYRSGTGGALSAVDEIGEYWCSDVLNTSESAALVLSSPSAPSYKFTQELRTHGFGICPMLE